MAEFKITITDKENFFEPNADNGTQIEIKVDVNPVPKTIEEYTPAQIYGIRLLEMIDSDRKQSEANAVTENTENTEENKDQVDGNQDT